jgi:hypothetical protein
MKYLITLILVALSLHTFGQTPLYLEDFESYQVGDYIGASSAYWTTWSGATGGAEDGQVSDEQANSGTQSLKIFGSVTGGPNDVYLPIGLETAYEVSFWIYVPTGYSQYINVQEELTPGITWAFDMVFSGNGSIQLSIDQVDIAFGSYNLDEWTSVSLRMDPINDRAEILIGGAYIANVPFDGIIGGLNFFGFGDGITAGLSYIDDLVVVETDDVLICNGCCQDPVACNYLSPQDDSCLYPIDIYGSENLDCEGNCLNDSDMDYVCDEDEILGCTDSEAYNYNPEATDSDNTLCIYFVPDCNSFGDPGWLDTESGTYPGQTSGVFGEMYNEDIALHLSNSIVEPGSGVSYALESFDFTSMSGLPEGITSAMSGEQMNPNSQVCVNISGIPIETGVFDILFTGEAIISVFGNLVDAGVISFTHTLEIGDNPNPISGCTYSGSDNYLLYAMVDDGSCIISGCTDPEASNFHPIFNLENGSCQYVEDISDCIEDLNQDGTIGTPDLLQLLSAYGQNCE